MLDCSIAQPSANAMLLEITTNQLSFIYPIIFCKLQDVMIDGWTIFVMI